MGHHHHSGDHHGHHHGHSHFAETREGNKKKD